ncbi:hypothetical protein ABT185_08645 [Streptomyces clavifer]|uniref:hypothetical protein n=1 Tax=Streptomyces clavifer TaxID=68188 RepID=UPI00333302EC
MSSRSIFDMSKSEAESASARPTRAEVAQGPLLDGPWAGSRCPGQRHGLQAAHGLVRVGTLQQASTRSASFSLVAASTTPSTSCTFASRARTFSAMSRSRGRRSPPM